MGQLDVVGNATHQPSTRDLITQDALLIQVYTGIKDIGGKDYCIVNLYLFVYIYMYTCILFKTFPFA